MEDAPTVRWRRRKESRPGELLHAALECFAERGFAATRLEDVAARAGVTKGTAYLYYASKEDLFKAVVRGYLVPVIASLEAAADAPGPVFQLLERVVGLFVEKVYESPLSAIPKLVISEAGNFPELAGFYLEEVIDRGRRLVGKLLNRGIASGEFREARRRAHGLLPVRATALLGAVEALPGTSRRQTARCGGAGQVPPGDAQARDSRRAAASAAKRDEGRGKEAHAPNRRRPQDQHGPISLRERT